MPGREVLDRETPHRKLAMICHNQQLYFQLGALEKFLFRLFLIKFFYECKIPY